MNQEKKVRMISIDKNDEQDAQIQYSPAIEETQIWEKSYSTK